MKLNTFLTLSIMIMLASCTIEKRIYMDGYHVEYLENKKALYDKIKKPDERCSKLNKQGETIRNATVNSCEQKIIDHASAVSANDPQIILTQREQIDFLPGYKSKPIVKEKSIA